MMDGVEIARAKIARRGESYEKWWRESDEVALQRLRLFSLLSEPLCHFGALHSTYPVLERERWVRAIVCYCVIPTVYCEHLDGSRCTSWAALPRE